MKTKDRISATLPDYIIQEIERCGALLELTKAEYLTAIAKKWFADGTPPVTPEEIILRKQAEKQPKISPQKKMI
ncbi:hypothetical protein OH491_10100 [Termitidicoccus mucosus]|uniref:Uncharacterized protein n=1 Tax=Termitidicoccus mucosus TaxID=1184151 RepID=A0A178IH04_9BACT|nr:hypothetical protein AW736_17240 [Opitutaceae bacterium TSB47]